MTCASGFHADAEQGLVAAVARMTAEDTGGELLRTAAAVMRLGLGEGEGEVDPAKAYGRCIVALSNLALCPQCLLGVASMIAALFAVKIRNPDQARRNLSEDLLRLADEGL